MLHAKVTAMNIRCHGDYHLGQVLWTGKDFVIIDFEGEPARPLSYRRLKRSALHDVAGMIRSFHYAAYTALAREAEARSENPAEFEPWVLYWYLWVSAAFLRSYVESSEGAPFMPRSREELQVLFDVFLLQKAIYELRYEINNRPEWVRIPLHGIVQLLEARD
jgi:maltose alpha-D-glucosyltransferase/alpha-amylase